MLAMDRRPVPSISKRLQSLRTRVARSVDRAQTGLRVHATAFLAVNGMLNVLNLVVLRGRFWWAYFPLAAWGIGLAVHTQAVLNRVRRKRQIMSLDDVEDERLTLISRIQRSEGRYRIHRMAYLASNLFLLGTNLLTGGPRPFPWVMFPVVGWGVGLILHRAAHRSRRARWRREIEDTGGTFAAIASPRRTSAPAEDPALASSRQIRDELLQQVSGDPELERQLGAELQPLLTGFVEQIGKLTTRRHEIEQALQDIDRKEMETELERLRQRLPDARDDSLRTEYTRAIEQHEQQVQSLEKLESRREIIDLRITSGHMMLKQLQLDALRLKSIDVSSDDSALVPLKKKTSEISRYLDDLQQTFDEMRET